MTNNLGTEVLEYQNPLIFNAYFPLIAEIVMPHLSTFLGKKTDISSWEDQCTGLANQWALDNNLPIMIDVKLEPGKEPNTLNTSIRTFYNQEDTEWLLHLAPTLRS